MKLIRKCGVLILHRALKCKRSGNTHHWWVAYSNGGFNLNWCNSRKTVTHRRFENLKAAINYFTEHIA